MFLPLVRAAMAKSCIVRQCCSLTLPARLIRSDSAFAWTTTGSRQSGSFDSMACASDFAGNNFKKKSSHSPCRSLNESRPHKSEVPEPSRGTPQNHSSSHAGWLFERQLLKIVKKHFDIP